MAKKTVASGLASKLGSKGREAFEKHKKDETDFGGGGRLPEGIDNGIAQLVECKFDVYKKGDNKGEYFFYAAGVVFQPRVHNGVRIEGKRTQIGPEPICDTPQASRKKTTEDHLSWVLNEMRKLGLTTKELKYENLEASAAALKKAKPFFSFRTWKGAKQTEGPYAGREPRTNETWEGVAEYNGQVPDDADDNSPADEPSEEPTAEAPVGTELPSDVTALAELADGGNRDAQVQLEQLAGDNGIGADVLEATESWAEVAGMLEGGGEESPSEDWVAMGKTIDAEEDDGSNQAALEQAAEKAGLDPDTYETWEGLGEALAQSGGADGKITPVKGNVYFYRPPKARKAVECECSAVFEGRETCNLKNMDDGTRYKAVPWTDLQKDEIPF